MSRMTLVSVGDVVMTRPWAPGRRSADRGFDAVVRLLHDADVVFGDLETPLSTRGYPREKLVTLRAEPGTGRVLSDIGFQVLSLANNHALDYGEEALLDTIDVLKRSDLRAVGAGANLDDALAPQLVEAAGCRLAFLACSCLLPVGSAADVDRPGLAPVHVRTAYETNAYYQMEEPGHPPVVRTWVDSSDLERVKASIARVRGHADLVAVSVHMGFGFGTELAEYERPLAHSLVDAGADVILGNHVHAVHGVEAYRGKAILYSQGNFIAQQPRAGMSEEVLAIYAQMSPDAYIAIIKVGDAGGYELRLVPVSVDGEGLPAIAVGQVFDRIAARVVTTSADLGTTVRLTSDGLAVDLASAQ